MRLFQLPTPASDFLTTRIARRYGIVGLSTLWFAWASYRFLLHPAKYSQSLLCVFGFANTVLQEYLRNDLPAVESPFESPPLRFGTLQRPT